MKVSALVVTKNRQKFTDWWTWNLTKQTRLPDEVVVIDTTEYATEKAMIAADDDINKRLRSISEVRITHFPSTYVTGESRQAALEACTGDILTWWDDDDWYHPRRLEVTAQGFLEGDKHTNVVITPIYYHLIVKDRVLVPLETLKSQMLIGGLGMSTDLAQLFRFEPILVGEDSVWLTSIFDHLLTNGRGGVERIKEPNMWGIVLIHGENTFGGSPRHNLHFFRDLCEEPLLDTPPYGVEQPEWDTFLEKLSKI